MRSPLNYLGGKSRLAEKIVNMIPKDHKCYCEPFCGAAWVLFRKEPSKVEVINDMDGELVTFWRVIQNHLQEFLRYMKFAIVSREIFELEQKKDPETLTDVQRAVRYYYLQRCGYGGRTTRRTFAPGSSKPVNLNLLTMEEDLMNTHWRIARVTIENADACTCVERYDRSDTFFYIDPPYWKKDGYAYLMKDKDFIRLRETLDKIKGRFILSLNDVPEVRKIYKGFTFKKVALTYSAGNSNVTPGTRGRTRHEVLISNIK